MVENSIIILVDDDMMNLEFTTRALKKFYTVYPVPSASVLFEMLESITPELILLDVEMPLMDGYETIKILKADERFSDIPVIFLTAKTDENSELEGLALGGADYIAKPFNTPIMKARIDTHLKMAEQKREIERLSFIDSLTKIPNRRSFDKQMLREWRYSIRQKIPLSVLMLDVDHFKIFNDTYGHQQGDIVLQTLADVMESTLKRSTDTVARWGGEEFAALLPDTKADGAVSVAEDIRKNIEETAIPNIDGASQVLHVTVSIGVACITPSDNDSIEDFIRLADEALYKAKAEGRNKVCLSNA